MEITEMFKVLKRSLELSKQSIFGHAILVPGAPVKIQHRQNHNKNKRIHNVS